MSSEWNVLEEVGWLEVAPLGCDLEGDLLSLAPPFLLCFLDAGSGAAFLHSNLIIRIQLHSTLKPADHKSSGSCELMQTSLSCGNLVLCSCNGKVSHTNLSTRPFTPVSQTL